MWTNILMTFSVLGLSVAQRSPYASMGTGLQLLPRFRPAVTDTSSGASSSGTGTGTVDADLSNRINSGEFNIPTTTPLPADLEGTLEDNAFVHWVSTWPVDRQPYWFRNRHAIKSQRFQPIDGERAQEGQAADNLPWFIDPQGSATVGQEDISSNSGTRLQGGISSRRSVQLDSASPEDEEDSRPRNRLGSFRNNDQGFYRNIQNTFNRRSDKQRTPDESYYNAREFFNRGADRPHYPSFNDGRPIGGHPDFNQHTDDRSVTSKPSRGYNWRDVRPINSGMRINVDARPSTTS